MADENIISETAQNVEKLFKSQPWYVWAGAAAAAGIVFYFVWQRKSTASTASTNASTAPIVDPNATLGYSPTNGPVANFPGFQEIGVNGEQVPLVPFGDNPIYDSAGNLIGFQQPAPVQAPIAPPTPQPQPPTPQPPIIPDPGPPHPLQNPPEQELIYTVQRGDSLSSIAAKLGLHSGWQALYAKNRTLIGDNPNFLRVGERLDYTGIGGGGAFHIPVNAHRNTVGQWSFANGLHAGHGDDYVESMV